MNENSSRPLSPHISQYKFAWPMLYSITHRITGVFLMSGLFWILTWLFVVQLNVEYYITFSNLNSSLIGTLYLVILIWAISFHFLNGIRHLFWDLHIGFSLHVAKISGNMVLLISIISTIIACFTIINI